MADPGRCRRPLAGQGPSLRRARGATRFRALPPPRRRGRKRLGADEERLQEDDRPFRRLWRRGPSVPRHDRRLRDRQGILAGLDGVALRGRRPSTGAGQHRRSAIPVGPADRIDRPSQSPLANGVARCLRQLGAARRLRRRLGPQGHPRRVQGSGRRHVPGDAARAGIEPLDRPRSSHVRLCRHAGLPRRRNGPGYRQGAEGNGRGAASGTRRQGRRQGRHRAPGRHQERRRSGQRGPQVRRVPRRLSNVARPRAEGGRWTDGRSGAGQGQHGSGQDGEKRPSGRVAGHHRHRSRSSQAGVRPGVVSVCREPQDRRRRALHRRMPREAQAQGRNDPKGRPMAVGVADPPRRNQRAPASLGSKGRRRAPEACPLGNRLRHLRVQRGSRRRGSSDQAVPRVRPALVLRSELPGGARAQLVQRRSHMERGGQAPRRPNSHRPPDAPSEPRSAAGGAKPWLGGGHSGAAHMHLQREGGRLGQPAQAVRLGGHAGPQRRHRVLRFTPRQQGHIRRLRDRLRAGEGGPGLPATHHFHDQLGGSAGVAGGGAGRNGAEPQSEQRQVPHRTTEGAQRPPRHSAHGKQHACLRTDRAGPGSGQLRGHRLRTGGHRTCEHVRSRVLDAVARRLLRARGRRLRPASAAGFQHGTAARHSATGPDLRDERSSQGPAVPLRGSEVPTPPTDCTGPGAAGSSPAPDRVAAPAMVCLVRPRRSAFVPGRPSGQACPSAAVLRRQGSPARPDLRPPSDAGCRDRPHGRQGRRIRLRRPAHRSRPGLGVLS